MATAIDVARFFVNLFKDTEEGITNLKLQKLLYYAQGISYQRFNAPLFNDDIEAWDNGPVVNVVYQKYKSCGREPIRYAEASLFPKDKERLLLDVAREYGKFTSSALVNETHKAGTPWDEYYEENIKRKVIPKEAIEKHFKNNEKCVEVFDILDYLPQPTAVTVADLETWEM